MLPKRNRVSKKLGQEVFDKGTIIHGIYMYLKLLPFPGTARFSVVVPKKVAKTSVARHRLKRQVHHCIASYIKEIPDGYTGLIFLKKEAVNTPYRDLCSDVEEVLRRANLLR